MASIDDLATQTALTYQKVHGLPMNSTLRPKERYNTLRPSPPNAKYKLAVVQFKVPGAKNGGSDKGPDGNRVDSIPIANGVIKAGGACDLILYDYTKNVSDTKEFEALTSKCRWLWFQLGPRPHSTQRTVP